MQLLFRGQRQRQFLIGLVTSWFCVTRSSSFCPVATRRRAACFSSALLLDNNQHNNNSNNNEPSKDSEPISTMKRPLLDSMASTLFRLETSRVAQSSEMDFQGRIGEPMEWSQSNSWANRLSQIMAGGIGYQFKQWVADRVAGDFDQTAVAQQVEDFIQNSHTPVTMYSFTTCPFCRRAKDYLEERQIAYSVTELDETADGNAIRAVLGRKTRRTSVPAIFVRGEFIGGCNDGPGLVPLGESGQLERMLSARL